MKISAHRHIGKNAISARPYILDLLEASGSDLGMFLKILAWIGPHFAYFKGPGTGFGPFWTYIKPKSVHLGDLGLDLGHFGGSWILAISGSLVPILSLNRLNLGIWDLIWAILMGPGSGFGPLGPILSLNRPIWGIWDWIWAILRGPWTGFQPI